MCHNFSVAIYTSSAGFSVLENLGPYSGCHCHDSIRFICAWREGGGREGAMARMMVLV